MKYSLVLAAAAIFASGASHAVTSFPGALKPGSNTIAIDVPIATHFDEAITFSLTESSNVSGTIGSLAGSVSLLDVHVQRFSETGDTPLVSVTPSNVGGVATFNLGQLWAPTGFGFESGLYTLSLSGLKPSGATALNLSLNVTPVPEPSSWALLGLGLVGLAFVQQTRMKKPDQMTIFSNQSLRSTAPSGYALVSGGTVESLALG